MTIRIVRNIRRVSQVLFFVIFLWLILKTSFEVTFGGAANDIQLPYPVSIFLQFDPLAAISTVLGSGTLYPALLWSLVILIPTIFLGRFFCGWICPMGTFNHWISGIRPERLSRKGARRADSNRYRDYQQIKYYVLFVFLGAAVAGSMLSGLLDPLPLLARSIGTFFLPVLHTLAAGVTSWVKSLGVPFVGHGAQIAYDLFAYLFLPYRQPIFHGIVLLGTVFVITLIMNRIFTRFWCRGICPLGALLGLFSRFAIFGLEKRHVGCDHCSLCLQSCQGADNPQLGERWRQAECHLCLNCQAACPNGSLSFKFFPNRVDAKENPAGTADIHVTRRKVLASLAGGVALVPIFRSSDIAAGNPNEKLIRPPGSLAEYEFLTLCIRCGQCMRVCPNNALHPTMLEAGLEGLWTPMLIARIGYCEPTCTLCTQVCPTGAIAKLTLLQKVGDKTLPANRIGTAFVDRGRCLPWAMATPCIVCEEWCPTSPKSIYFQEESGHTPSGQTVTLKRPYVDPALCTGCGACEFACPIVDEPAIRITSVGESRSVNNQFLLNRRKPPVREAKTSS